MTYRVQILHGRLYGQNFKNKMVAKKQNGPPIKKLSITHSFLELQSPDFAWKFIWTVRTNYEKKLVRGQKIAVIGCQLLVQKRKKDQNTQKEQTHKRAKKLHLSASY